MRDVFEYPPMFDLIDAKFRVAGRPIIFSWGGIIYNPQRIEVTPALRAHEAVHGARQGDDIRGWWRRYIDDPVFRLVEEIPAHRAEYQQLLAECDNRRARRLYLKQMAKRLASPLYGNVTTVAKARKFILEAA